jgi:sirohydrochlorin ferrochelatase
VRNPRLSPLVAVAHGSKDPRAAATVSELLAVVRERLGPGGPTVRAAFLDHCAPSLPQALASLASAGPARGRPGPVRCIAEPVPCITVPLLLTSAYHTKADIPAQLAAASDALPGLEVRCAAPLGPHPLLLTALERRLREAGIAVDDARVRAATSVVLAAAGSSDPAANRAIAALAVHWAASRGWKTVIPAYASAAGPRPADAVTTLREASGGPVVVASYLLAPGYFADKIRSAALAAGASAVSAVLGAAPEVAAVVQERYLAAESSVASNREPVPASRLLLLSSGASRRPARSQPVSHQMLRRSPRIVRDREGKAAYSMLFLRDLIFLRDNRRFVR